MHKILSSRIMLSTFIINNQREDLSYTNGEKTVLMVNVPMHGRKKTYVTALKICTFTLYDNFFLFNDLLFRVFHVPAIFQP